MSELIGTTEACQILGCGKASLYRLEAAGKLASVHPRYKTKGGERVLDRRKNPVVVAWRVYWDDEVAGVTRTQKFPGTPQQYATTPHERPARWT